MIKNSILKIIVLVLMVCFCCSCKNHIKVDCGTLYPNDFEIYLSAGLPLRCNDNLTIIYKNGSYYEIPNEYGENDWLIVYKGQKQCWFRHFKTNRRNTHKYKFAFFEKHDTLFCAIDIRGNNAEKDTFILQKEQWVNHVNHE